MDILNRKQSRQRSEMTGSDAELSHVQRYQQIVLQYEALDEQIDALIMEYGGGSENMPPDAYARYRDLARQRDELFNEMRELEQLLDIDEDTNVSE